MSACMLRVTADSREGRAADERLSQQLGPGSVWSVNMSEKCEKACVCTPATGSFVLVLRVIIAGDEPGRHQPVCGRAGGYEWGFGRGTP